MSLKVLNMATRLRSRRRLTRLGRLQLIDSAPSRFEDLADRFNPYASDIAQSVGDIENKPVHRLFGRVEIAFGGLTLRLGFATVDLGEAGERYGDDGDAERAADPIPLPHGRCPPARRG